MLAQRANIMIKKKSNLVLAAGLLSSRYAQCVKIPGKKSHFLVFCCRWKSRTASCQTSSSAWQKHFYPLNSGPSLWPRSGWGTLPQLKTNKSNEMPRATKLTRLNFLLSSLVYFYHHQLLSSKKDQKLRKNNGVNNTRKNLTFLTVLGLSKEKREKGKEIKEEKPKRYIIPPEYYPCTTPLWICMFLIVLVWILFGKLERKLNFRLFPNFEFYYCVNPYNRNKCAVFICQPKIRARMPSNRVLDFLGWLGGLYEVGCESW